MLKFVNNGINVKDFTVKDALWSVSNMWSNVNGEIKKFLDITCWKA